MQVNGVSALANLGQAAESQATIAENFDAFLSLLTTQLQNQNPLEPLDTNEFTAQLVQFTNVEQAIETNKNLEQLVALSVTSAFTSAVGYIGKTVVASGQAAELSGGIATWNYDLSAPSPDTQITVFNSAGLPVHTETRSAASGDNSFVWNGQLSDGTAAPAGTYTIQIDAKDANGNTVSVDTEIEGEVTAVDLTGAEPVLTVNGQEIALSKVKSIRS